MSKFLKLRAKKSGMPPGVLINPDAPFGPKINISITEFDQDTLRIKNDPSINDCLISLKSPETTWINICGLHDTQAIETIGKHFNLHPLILEDIVTIGQRPKLDNYKDTIFLIIRMLKYNDKTKKTEDEQISLVVGANYLITFVENTNDPFISLRTRLSNNYSRQRQKGIDYFCYTLIDFIVDNYFVILEKIDEKMESLEEELVKRPSPQTLQKIQHSKREIVLLRKSVWPTREVISNFRRLDSPIIQEETKLYIQDVYDHTIQAIDTIESFRDITGGMLDIYLSNISLRMNEIMKVLTIVATIFVPLTFIASIYGMNFDHMPELHWKYGYYYALGIMVITSLLMLYYFKRKGWL